MRRAAALILYWEGLWPPLAFAGVVALLFAAASWFGLWFETPPYLRLAALALFALAFIAALAPLAKLGWPHRAQSLARLDRDASVTHRPASGFEDKLVNAGDDPATRALWALHKERLARNVDRLGVKAPSPNLAGRDPYALRFAAVLLALVGAMAAGSERFARLAAAFHGMPTLARNADTRVDAWVDPPAYTGKPPIFLKIGEAGAAKAIFVPERSILVVRSDSKDVSVSTSGGLTQTAATSGQERRFSILANGAAKIYRGGALAADVDIRVAAKTPPSIRLLEPPKNNISGSLTLHYAIDDAYGVQEAAGAVVLAEPGAQAAHALFGPPALTLSLPEGAKGTGEAHSTVDLSEHPWAGARVALSLTATSVSQARTTSPPVEIVLPQKRFINPLAKALVELRRDLVLDPDRNKPRVAAALAALRLGPELFETSPRVYLDLDGAERRLAVAKNDDDLRDVAAWLWTLALSIENGDASQALKDLRAAADKLRQALRDGARRQKLKELSQQLRDASERYLAEMMRNADKQAMQDAESMDSTDMDAMLDRLQKDADAGAKEDAQAMLDQLQEMMENLRNAENGKQDQAGKEMRQSLRDLDKLLKDQQALRDDTFREDQRERSGSSPSESGKESGALEQRQRALHDRLEGVEKRLRGLGAETPKNLDDATGDMSEAERNLKGEGQDGQDKSKRRFGHSPKGDAVEAQGKAIEALRQGGQSLRQQMRGKGQGKGGYVGLPGAKDGKNDDPLGRGQDGSKGAAEGQLSGGADRADRARRVLEEVRRRLANPSRSSDERDYLERLIDRP
ncbi:MAG: TIGR02302 family protein [Pseudomonadota bacterium]|nr:TIGR02302 family protein [Pseudomonadota bacterium]